MMDLVERIARAIASDQGEAYAEHRSEYLSYGRVAASCLKPLSWTFFPNGYPPAFDARTPWGTYSIEELCGPNVEDPTEHPSDSTEFHLSFRGELVGVYLTETKAKSAAQQDHERRIAEAFQP